MASYLDLDKEKGYSELIDKLVEAKSQPIKQLEKDKSKEELKIEVVDDLSKEIGALKKYSDQLFGLRSSFKKKKFNSTDSSILEGSVKNTGPEGDFKVEILKVAKSHRIASKPIQSDDFFPPGDFSIKVGKEKVKFKFKGGSIRDLEKVINKSKKGLLELSVVKKNDKESLVILSSTKTGINSEISLGEDPDGVLKQLSFFEKNRSKDTDLFPPNLASLLKSGVLNGKTLKLSPMSGENISISDMDIGGDDNFEIRVSWRNIKKLPAADGKVPEEKKDETDWSMKLDISEKIEFEDLSFDSSGLYSFLPRDKTPAPTPTPEPKPLESTNSLFLTVNGQGKGGAVSKAFYLPKSFFDKDTGEASISFSGSEFASDKNGGSLSSLSFTNGNSSFELSISEPIIKRKASGKEFVPGNEVSPAQNAKIIYKGIEVERENNDVSDLIDGVDLNIKRTSNGEISFTVEKDRDYLFNQLINFIGQFNIYMGKMNILLSRKPAPDDAKEAEEKRYGLFKDELTFKMMRDKLRSVTVNPHPTSEPEELALLSQLGITSVFVLGNPDDPDARKLDLQEDEFNSTYASKGDLIADLFGYDSNGDLIIDSGVAFEISQIARNYIGSGSVFELKKNTYKSRIKNIKKDIERKEKQLDSFRAQQELEFSKLNSAQKQMEKMQDLLKNGMN